MFVYLGVSTFVLWRDRRGFQDYVGCPFVICAPLSTPLYRLRSEIPCCTCQSNRWFCRAGVISWMICDGCDGAGVSWKQRTFHPVAETGRILDALPRIVPFCATAAQSVRKSQPLWPSVRRTLQASRRRRRLRCWWRKYRALAWCFSGRAHLK